MDDFTLPPRDDRDLRDVVIEHLAADEADLRARVRELEADVVAYRELAQVALAVAHDLTRERDDYRRRYHAALDENRRLRADPQQCRRGRAA